MNIINLRNTLEKSFASRSLNEICEYLYRLTSSFNALYSNCEVLTEKDGEALYDWANAGEDFAFNISKAQTDIINLATELGGSKDSEVKAATIDILKEANPKNCTNEALLKQSLKALNSLKASRGGSK